MPRIYAPKEEEVESKGEEIQKELKNKQEINRSDRSLGAGGVAGNLAAHSRGSWLQIVLCQWWLLILKAKGTVGGMAVSIAAFSKPNT